MRLGDDGRAVTMLEYGLVAAVCVGAVTTPGTNIQTELTGFGTSI